MREKLPINEILMWILFLITVGWLFFGCSSTKELEHRNAMQFQAAVKVISYYMAKADSLEESLERCKNIKEIMVKR